MWEKSKVQIYHFDKYKTKTKKVISENCLPPPKKKKHYQTVAAPIFSNGRRQKMNMIIS